MRPVNQSSGPHLEVEPKTASIFARFLQILYFLWAVAFFFGFMCAEILCCDVKAASTVLSVTDHYIVTLKLQQVAY